jgi:pilus assembly protein CpaE
MATRILAVDDSPLILKLIESILSRAGHQVFTALSGPEALALVDEVRPDLVILDVTMPEMNGYEVCRILRQTPLTAQSPILILTSLDSLENKMQGFEAGADDYMVKPFQAAELCARVEALMRRSAAALKAGLAVTYPESQATASIVSIFSLRGGVGVSTLAANLAVGLAQIWALPTILIDLALTTGQAALMLDLPLRHTWADLAGVPLEEIDAALLNQILLQHASGVRVLAAPRRPEQSTMVSTDQIAHVIELLSQSYHYMILDLPHDLQDASLTGLDASHQILALMAPEVASVRAMASTLDIFEALRYPNSKVRLVLNKTFQRHGLGTQEIQGALKREIAIEIPFAPDTFVPAVNSGRPPVFEAPASPVGVLLEDLAFSLSQDKHKVEQPESPTAAWKRVVERMEKHHRPGGGTPHRKR